jgi:hypothetical protein
MGAVGVAVAALGAAYLVLAHDVEEAEKAQEAAAKRAAAAAGAFNGFTASIRALDVEVSKLVGSYDEIEEASKKRERAFQRQAVQAERFLTKEIEATKVEQDRLRALQRSGDASDETTAALQRANQRLTAQSTQLSAVRDRTERFRLENELLTETLQERKAEEEAAKIAAEELKQADEAAARAADRRAEAEAKQKQEIDALVAAGKARAAQVDRDIDLQRQNAAIVQQTTAVELSAMGRLAKATEDQLAKAEQVRQQRIENAAGDRFLELQAEQQFQETKTVLTSEYERQRTELLRAETLERQRLAEEEHQRSLQNLATFSTTTLGALNSTLAGMSQLAADAKSKEQARDLFMAAKVTGIGLALTNTAVAATKALSQLGAFGGPVAAAAITAAGLVQVETIRRQKPPAFYRGTSDVQPASGGADAVPAILHQGEAVLNRRAADSMGRGNIDDMNAGRRRGSPPVVAISQINHRQFRDFYRDDRSLPGSLTRRDRNRNGTKIGRQL